MRSLKLTLGFLIIASMLACKAEPLRLGAPPNHSIPQSNIQSAPSTETVTPSAMPAGTCSTAGFYCSPGSTSALPCGLGFYCPADSQAPLACPNQLPAQGKYASEVQATAPCAVTCVDNWSYSGSKCLPNLAEGTYVFNNIRKRLNFPGDCSTALVSGWPNVTAKAFYGANGMISLQLLGPSGGASNFSCTNHVCSHVNGPAITNNNGIVLQGLTVGNFGLGSAGPTHFELVPNQFTFLANDAKTPCMVNYRKN